MPKPSKALTLVEVLVIVTILFILMGLWIPLGPRNREHARRNQCSTNLKNLALATHQFDDVHGRLPGWAMNFGVHPGRPEDDVATTSAQSPHHKIGTWAVAILPWLDAQPTYEHWSEDRYPIVGGGDPDEELSSGRAGIGFNRLAAPNLSIMQCSSNPVDDSTHGRNSYISNNGVFFPTDNPTSRRHEVVSPDGTRAVVDLVGSMSTQYGAFANELIGTPNLRSLSDFVDGAAHTILFSENVQAMPWHRVGLVDQEDLLVKESDPAVPNPRSSRFAQGLVWHSVDWEAGQKAASVHRINGTTSNQASDDIFVLLMNEANASDLARPSSAHVDGVNTSWADGSTRFIEDSIYLQVWHAMLTPAGGD